MSPQKVAPARGSAVGSAASGDGEAAGARLYRLVWSSQCGRVFTSDAALGGPFLAKSRYHIACGRRKTASSPVWDLFVRLQKRLLNDDYAARRSICAFSAVEGMWAVRAYRVVLRRFDECDSQRRLFDPTEPLLLRGGGLQTTRPNFRVAVLLKYRSNAHDVVEGTYADDPGPIIGSLRKLLGGR